MRNDLRRWLLTEPKLLLSRFWLTDSEFSLEPPVAQYSMDEEILEIIDGCWKKGEEPDFSALVAQVRIDDPNEIIPDALMSDMEWRWKQKDPGLRRSLIDYELLLPRPLSTLHRAKVLCREFGIRSRWGDCVSREELCNRHPELSELFVKHVEREIRDIAEWPVVSIFLSGSEVASTPLDRTITAGRQASMDQNPWSIISSPFSHHLVLCEMRNPALSREQLEIRLCPGKTVQIRNTSRSRAIAVRSGRTAIDAGKAAEFPIDRPIDIHLYAQHFIRIR